MPGCVGERELVVIQIEDARPGETASGPTGSARFSHQHRLPALDLPRAEIPLILDEQSHWNATGIVLSGVEDDRGSGAFLPAVDVERLEAVGVFGDGKRLDAPS